MVSYFSKDLAENEAATTVTQVSNVKTVQGDLAAAWREGEIKQTTPAWRLAVLVVDKTMEWHQPLVAGHQTPVESTDGLDFSRQAWETWELSGDHRPKWGVAVHRLDGQNGAAVDLRGASVLNFVAPMPE